MCFVGVKMVFNEIASDMLRDLNINREKYLGWGYTDFDLSNYRRYLYDEGLKDRIPDEIGDWSKGVIPLRVRQRRSVAYRKRKDLEYQRKMEARRRFFRFKDTAHPSEAHEWRAELKNRSNTDEARKHYWLVRRMSGPSYAREVCSYVSPWE